MILILFFELIKLSHEFFSVIAKFFSLCFKWRINNIVIVNYLDLFDLSNFRI